VSGSNAESESPWTFAAESAVIGRADAVTLVDGTSFVISGSTGDIGQPGVTGLFMLDTRVLSRWSLAVNGAPVEVLSVIPNGPFSATFAGRIPDSELVDAPLSVIRRRHVGNGMREDLEIRNHGAAEQSVVVELAVGADFANLFAVKAGRVGEILPTSAFMGEDRSEVVISRGDVEGGVDACVIRASIPPDGITESVLRWELVVEPDQSWSVCFIVGVVVDGQRLHTSHVCGESVEDAIPISRLRQWHGRVTQIATDDARLQSALHRSGEDLGALRIFDADHPERAVVAAGAPWFMTLFGRDSLLASWMALLLDPDLAEGVLLELAESQGVSSNPVTEEQPGRILHEVRFDTASARLLGGANTYYGTVDATPLFVMLVAELARWTGLSRTVTDLMPAVDRALAWIEEFGDRDGDGFVEYLRSDVSGLENQGWKDSWDGLRNVDGTVPTGPIALCEVQGYVYAALRGRAELGAALGEASSVVLAFEERAAALRDRFDRAFWIEGSEWYAIGLDGDKQQIGSLTSNIGHLLWTGIVPPERAEHLAAHLTSPEMFSGWGLRTMSATNVGYNPLSYHCGSVWPHDTALAAAGLMRYGCDAAAHQLIEGLLEASVWTAGRLPELFAGFSKDDLAAPVPYPASCSPQAWSSAAPLLLVRAMLGLDPNMLAGKVHVQPSIPEGMNRLELTDVRIGEQRVSVSVRNDELRLEGLADEVAIRFERRPPQ
jgi:glycogen debranching enzyme